MPHLALGTWANNIVTWMQNHLAVVFSVISNIFNGVNSPFRYVLGHSNWVIMLMVFALIALLVSGVIASIVSILGALLVQDMGLWLTTMHTLALVITSGIFALVIGIPFGILAGEMNRVRTILRPVLDLMQTMPPFVYLIPAVLFFGLGLVPAVFATFIFAAPPVIRLTELGLRQVPKDLVEAGEAYGATPLQLLWKIKIPQATPSILAGINQTIMLALSMVVIAGMIGAGGLGAIVLKGISTLNVGVGFKGGLAVVLTAIYLDRITERVGHGGFWFKTVKRRRI